MIQRVLFVAGTLAVAASAYAAEPRRELGAHEHGHAFLNLAIDGNVVVMELQAPGADIVASEAKPETPEAKAAQAAAIKALEQPLALFRLPESAACKVTSAKGFSGIWPSTTNGPR